MLDGVCRGREKVIGRYRDTPHLLCLVARAWSPQLFPVFAVVVHFVQLSLATIMSFSPGMPPPPPPGMPSLPPGMAPPPGMPTQGRPSGSMPPEVLAQKSQKWVQMQKRRYGEKRKGGYVDMGKQVSMTVYLLLLRETHLSSRICHLSMFEK